VATRVADHQAVPPALLLLGMVHLCKMFSVQ